MRVEIRAGAAEAEEGTDGVGQRPALDAVARAQHQQDGGPVFFRGDALRRNLRARARAHRDLFRLVISIDEISSHADASLPRALFRDGADASHHRRADLAVSPQRNDAGRQVPDVQRRFRHDCVFNCPADIRRGRSETITILITDDAFAESAEIFFVRQHYHDFLNREPDDAGLQFWTNEITSCGSDAACSEVKRVNVSAAFFLSIEFQETGYLRSNPDDSPDADFRGWDFWLSKLNQFNGNFVQAEMVKAFINSDEYRKRFGQ